MYQCYNPYCEVGRSRASKFDLVGREYRKDCELCGSTVMSTNSTWLRRVWDGIHLSIAVLRENAPWSECMGIPVFIGIYEKFVFADDDGPKEEWGRRIHTTTGFNLVWASGSEGASMGGMIVDVNIPVMIPDDPYNMFSKVRMNDEGMFYTTSHQHISWRLFQTVVARTDRGEDVSDYRKLDLEEFFDVQSYVLL